MFPESTDLTKLGTAEDSIPLDANRSYTLWLQHELHKVKTDVDKVEDKYTKSYNSLNTTLNDMKTQMDHHIMEAGYKGRQEEEMNTMTKKNADDIGELKSSVKSVEESNSSIKTSIDILSHEFKEMGRTITNMDKKLLDKGDVTEIVDNAIIKDKTDYQTKWFESLPAKVSAGVALISFIAFFTIKIVLMLLAV